MNNLRVNSERLWDSLMEMGRIGATAGGGVGRLALTDLDRQARDLFVRWCEQASCAVRIDRMGNIFARRQGSEDTLPPVMTGSHLDTQPLGGKFDGIYGVLVITSYSIHYTKLYDQAMLQANNLREAFEVFPRAMEEAMERMIEQIQRLQQEQKQKNDSRIIVPGR